MPLSVLSSKVRLLFCVVRPTHISLGLAMRAVSLFSSRAAALVSRVSRLLRSTLAQSERALSLLNLKKKIDCSQSAHSVLHDHLKKAMLAFFDQRSNHNVTLPLYKEKVNYYFDCFG